MTTTFIQTDQGPALLIPPELLAEADLKTGQEVETSVQDGKIVIAPARNGVMQNEEVSDEEFIRQADEFIERYRPALEALA